MIRIPLVIAACVVWLAGCATAPKLGDSSSNAPATEPSSASAEADAAPASGADAYAAATPEEAAGAAITDGKTGPGLLGSDAYDDLSLGKKEYRASNYGLAEQHFRKAVEGHPKDGEAWVGLAAANDRLHRFDLADRAYKEARRILGPTPELLNNQGFSYLLRGDFSRARQTLRQAQAASPNNPYVRNNLALLDKVARKGKGVQ